MSEFVANDDVATQRRLALAAAFDDVATDMVERVVAEAVRAATFFGLSGDVAKRYGGSIRETLPTALAALTEPEAGEREKKMDELVTSVRRVSDAHHVPRIIERGLVTIAFRFARGRIHDRAGTSGFSEAELDKELSAFRTDFETRLFGAP